MITIEFDGAAETVTGSNYLVRTPKGNFIVDCGMFQGPDVEKRNIQNFNYDPSEIDFVLLTHAHIDHSGMLPKLVKYGFSGEIFATNHTVLLTTELLLDSAKIQENNYKRGLPYGKFTGEVSLVYDTGDATQTISQFRSIRFRDTFSPIDGIEVTFIRAGHVLGAASIEVKIQDGGTTKTILFSGDIGRTKEDLIESFDLEYQTKPDYILMESLYGGIYHPPIEDSTQDLVNLIAKTIQRQGNVLIPSFALQRTQLMLNILRKAKLSGQLANDVQVWLDSPLAQRVTEIYIASLQYTDEDIFSFPKLRYARKYKQSLAIRSKTSQLIIAGSGMADGGRIVEHLQKGLANKRNSVAFVGYQAEGTLGRLLVEGKKEVRFGTKKVKVKSEIGYFHGFSAHGDTTDYENWLKPKTSSKLQKIFLIHAELDKSTAMKQYLANDLGVQNTYIPKWKEVIEL